jgi:hypothetical protein
MFNREKKIEKDLLYKSHKRITVDSKEKYYEYIKTLKKDLNERKDAHYLHFIEEGNNQNWISNVNSDNFNIKYDNLRLNLKDKTVFNIIVQDYLKRAGVENKMVSIFFNLLIPQIYKCIESKYLHREDITISKIIDHHLNYTETIKEYNKFAEKIIIEDSIRYPIFQMFSELKINEVLMDLKKENLNIQHQNISINKILEEKSIDVYHTEKELNIMLINLYFAEKIDIDFNEDDNVLKLDDYLKPKERKTIYVILDFVPNDCFPNHWFLSQLRGFKIRLVFPSIKNDLPNEILKIYSEEIIEG